MFSAARTVCKIATDCGREGRQLGHTFGVSVCSPRPWGGGQMPARTLPRGGPRAGCAGRRGGGQEPGTACGQSPGVGRRLGWVLS